MSGDSMGNKQRAWVCGGCGSFPDPIASIPRLLWPEPDDKRPVLVLPAHYGPEEVELAFGWAITELAERRFGWLGVVGRIILMSDPDAEVA